jgi:4-hydroxy-4-methyl-2-oxoglutarate aldolase
MLDDMPLLTVRREIRRPTPAQVAAFAGAMTGNIADALGGRGALDPAIKPHDPSIAVIAGPAITCHAFPADNLAAVGALHMAEPGDVIVCANDDFTETAVIGDLVCGMMKNKGVAAFVTDGMVRDQVGIEPWKLPIFCRGITPNSPARNGPGTVGLPITVGGRRVESGDMVVCDRDGVVVVPFAEIDAVIERLARIKTAEAEVEAKVKAGMAEPPYIAELFASDRVKFV